MSDFVVIHKQNLKDFAQLAPDKDSLLRVIEEKFDPNPENKYKFLIIPCDTAKHPAAYAVDESLDWQLIYTVTNFVGQVCPHLSLEEKERLVERILKKVNFKFDCTLRTLGEMLGDFLSNVREIIENDIGDGKQADGFEPESMERLVVMVWHQCEKGFFPLLCG